MVRIHPTASMLEVLKKRILDTDIPEAENRGVKPDLLQRCTKRLLFLNCPNPYKHVKGTADRSLALERLRKTSREVKVVRRRIQTAIVEATPPTQAELDVERFLIISRNQKAVLADSTGTPFKELRHQIVSRNAAFRALDIFIGTSTGYHARAYMDAQVEAGRNRTVIKSAVAFAYGKERFASMEDGALVSYKLQGNVVERGDLARSQMREPEPVEEGIFSAEYSEWLAGMLESGND